MWIAALIAAVLPLAAARSALRPRGTAVEAGDPRADTTYPYQPAVPYYEAPLQPCPQLSPADVDLDQLLGSWHLSLLLLADRASTGDGLLDESLCAGVDLVRTNDTMLRLDWQLHQMGLPAGLADVQMQVAAAILGQSGMWALATPLGGEMVGTVSHAAPRSHLVLSVCGDQQGAGRRGAEGVREEAGVHVLTALLTRRAPSALGSLELLRLSSLMLPATGFRRVDERLLSWGQC